jgi:hypothetical protein
VFPEGKVVPGFQPAVIRGCELIEWSAFDHRVSPGNHLLHGQRYGQALKLKIEIIEINRFRI